MNNPEKTSKKSRSGRKSRLWIFYLLFTLAWLVLLALIVPSLNLSWLLIAALAFTPLFALWGPFWMAVDQASLRRAQDQENEEKFAEIDGLRRELVEINQSLASLNKNQAQLTQELPPFLAQRVALLATPYARRESIAQTDFDSLNLPLPDDHLDRLVSLDDMAHVLNFSDRKARGDWANAFVRIRENGRYMEFVHLAEKVLEAFEQEGIYVEDLSLRPASPDIWRRFVGGERDGEMLLLAGVQDPSVLALVRARLRNEGALQDISLRYQKQFLSMLEELSPSASDEVFIALNRSRGGRLFVILGNISGTFGKVRVRI